ncbi:MAG: 2-hydroxyacid dehydrogenase [Gammaproteobacteria bacterium]|nr:2-hydroxyacid dehydrogenase [Gammaproteobacteria bacterium]NIR98209.1 2-hydroxyacid dehydrogenase [Gammaproteobacteria bacterium]NIT63880.1 2-hydroxyacid dehydrogenase [Gammaproteobacteria bacterium]NIV20884.1 2-hydroxyacid dehydrogenase [Gammaproteobacteria bacterium]NIY32460.1 2-hydroxyacid dehydrogenase [Gammaproteobacteria bacterium]
MQGVFLDRGSVDGGDLDLGGLQGSLSSWRFHDETRPEELAGRLADAEVAVSNKVVLDREYLEEAPRLRLICVAATGTNNVDLAAARERGITVCNVRGYATPSVVQHVYSLILALTTRVLDYRGLVAERGWQDSPHFCRLDFPIRELCGKVLGVVGYGELGRAVAEVAPAFGMQVRVAQRPGTAGQQEGRVALADLLPQVDVLTLHCPLADNTRNLIGAAELAAMKDDALLINAARGGIVDEQALADALRAGHPGGAGVDVLTEEPPRRGNPLLAADIPNLIVTPHIAWASRESRQRLVDQLAENIRAFRGGAPRNVVNA